MQLNNSASEGALSKDTPNDDNHKEIHGKTHLVFKEMTQDHVTEYHVENYAGLFPIWPIVVVALSPSGASKDKRKTPYMRCVLALFEEILLVDKKTAIASIEITNKKQEDMIIDSSKLPDNFTKLGKWLMMSGRCLVLNKKDSDVYAQFWLKSTIPVDEMVMRVSFEFSRLGGSKLYKKPNQAMETETPIMLLFVSNSTNPLSVSSDITQMLETAYDNVETDRMIPQELEYQDIPKFTLKLNSS